MNVLKFYQAVGIVLTSTFSLTASSFAQGATERLVCENILEPYAKKLKLEQRTPKEDLTPEEITTWELSILACQLATEIHLRDSDYNKIPGISGSGDITKANIEKENSMITAETVTALVKQIELRKERLIADRINAGSSRFVRGCFNKQQSGVFKTINEIFDSCTLRRTNSRNTVESSQGALFSFTRDLRNSDDEDDRNTFEIAAAFRGTGGIDGKTSWTFATEYQRNNTENSEQANFNISTGIIRDFTFNDKLTKAELNRLATADGENLYKDIYGKLYKIRNQFSSYRTNLNVEYNRTGLFGSPDTEACILDSNQGFCGRQNLESLRVVGGVSPYFTFLNGVSSKGGQPWQWAISPTGSVFYDTALNDNVVLPTGATVDGDVFGLVGGVSASLSPRVLRNRWQLSASAQIVEALDRSEGRRDTFEQTSRQFTSTLSFALIDDAYVGQTQSNDIIPAIAVVYTNGSDSLRGRSGVETLRLALTLLY